MGRGHSKFEITRTRSLRVQGVLAGLLCVSLSGCNATQVHSPYRNVSAEIAGRFGVGIGDERDGLDVLIPPDLLLSDAISEDEAIAVALWNNAALQETLTQLGVSRAQLLDAGLISDPQFVIFFPLGPKQLEFTAFQAVDALWLQPIRVRAAELDLDRISQSMVQNGLDVIRDVRVAHSNLVLATQQARVSTEAANLRADIAALARKRLDAGDISELEVTASAIDALQATAAADRATHDVTIARERLRALIGLTMHGHPLNTPTDSQETVALKRDADDCAPGNVHVR